MKKCSKCKLSKLLREFNKDGAKKDGLRSYCRECQNEYNQKKETKEYKKQWYQAYKEEIKESQKQWCSDNKEKVQQYYKQWYKENEKGAKEYKKQWHQTYKDEINLHAQKRYENDLQYKLALNLRTRINQAIKIKQRGGSAVRDLGCSITEFQQFIAQKFQLNMSWENYGAWHLDHIIPLASFDLTDRLQFLKACHYTNYQPLWAKDNLKKKDSINWNLNENY